MPLIIRLALLVCLIGVLQAEEASFTPPKNWKAVHQSPASSVKISFVGKPKKNCLPVINLATEEVDISLKEYLALVQKNCESNPSKEWKDLGKFSTRAGEGRLTEILHKTTGGTLRQLQLILLKNQTIYVLTSSCAHEDFLTLAPDFYAAFKSFNIK